ncbi:hypothetical protein PoB_000917800 [Plakobranchus ocellatus]|uniref:Uncharacterized protein n=1 Tax=Plakobranchus ocellatus TaxID=259542 RepID=A0AAV3YKC6_9GAST|nr:hypothetical protein PoB_000917800 [Plakobranchus ocellatus]
MTERKDRKGDNRRKKTEQNKRKEEKGEEEMRRREIIKAESREGESVRIGSLRLSNIPGSRVGDASISYRSVRRIIPRQHPFFLPPFFYTRAAVDLQQLQQQKSLLEFRINPHVFALRFSGYKLSRYRQKKEIRYVVIYDMKGLRCVGKILVVINRYRQTDVITLVAEWIMNCH